MRGLRRLMLAGFLGAALSAPAAVAQGGGETRIVPYEFPRSAAYDRTVRFQRLQSELVYIDALDGEIPMDGLALRPPPEPERRRDTGAELTTVELSSRLILLVAALAAAVLVWRNRASLLARLGRAPADRAAPARRAGAGAGGAAASDPGLVDRLRAMADRETALVLLLHATLETAAQANGLRLGRSETAREFLRRLPSGWAHLSALRRLVMAEELVQFGGRRLAEETFEQCLHDAVPILRGAGSG